MLIKSSFFLNWEVVGSIAQLESRNPTDKEKLKSLNMGFFLLFIFFNTISVHILGDLRRQNTNISIQPCPPKKPLKQKFSLIVVHNKKMHIQILHIIKENLQMQHHNNWNQQIMHHNKQNLQVLHWKKWN